MSTASIKNAWENHRITNFIWNNKNDPLLAKKLSNSNLIINPFYIHLEQEYRKKISSVTSVIKFLLEKHNTMEYENHLMPFLFAVISENFSLMMTFPNYRKTVMDNLYLVSISSYQPEIFTKLYQTYTSYLNVYTSKSEELAKVSKVNEEVSESEEESEVSESEEELEVSELDEESEVSESEEESEVSESEEESEVSELDEESEVSESEEESEVSESEEQESEEEVEMGEVEEVEMGEVEEVVLRRSLRHRTVPKRFSF